jgi:hypothetical protein
MNPECERFVPLILRRADGTLDQAARGQLEAHMAVCGDCRRALADQTAVSRVVGELGLGPVPRDFAARVRARVAPVPGLLDLINWRRWTLRLAPVAALLALLAWYPVVPDTSRATNAQTQTIPAALDEWAGTQAQVAEGVLGIGPNASSDRDALLAAALGETSR